MWRRLRRATRLSLSICSPLGPSSLARPTSPPLASFPCVDCPVGYSSDKAGYPNLTPGFLLLGEPNRVRSYEAEMKKVVSGGPALAWDGDGAHGAAGYNLLRFGASERPSARSADAARSGPAGGCPTPGRPDADNDIHHELDQLGDGQGVHQLGDDSRRDRVKTPANRRRVRPDCHRSMNRIQSGRPSGACTMPKKPAADEDPGSDQGCAPIQVPPRRG